MSVAALALAAGLDAAPVIDVLGRRREAEAVDRPGRSVVIRPEDASRFDVAALLQPMASLALPETGRINASGFAVPRVRGQDARFTEVYVEDLLLQDPYTGLPVVDDLDLRAFGELALHRGLPPPTLPSLNPVGILQYRLRPITRPSLALGATGGKPYGLASWLAADHHERFPESVFAFRGYARRHRSGGRYPYYSDNATPYNTADDEILTREDNARASEQFLPFAELRDGPETWRLLALWHHAKNGVPSQTPGRRSNATEEVTSNLGTLSWNRDGLGLTISANEDKRASDDPDRLVFGPRGNARAKVSGRKIAAQAAWGDAEDPVQGAVFLEGTSARVDTRAVDAESAVAVRKAAAATGALALRPTDALAVEVKARGRRERDTFEPSTRDDLLAEDEDGDRARATQGVGLAAGLGRWPGPQIYAQAATQTRSPTLLEEFGDGNLIRGNPALKPERLRHLEIGTTLPVARLRWDAALFEDTVDDRVTLLASLAQSLRAVNVAETRVRGAELRVGFRAESVETFAEYVRYEPLDRTNPEDPKLLPGVPRTVATAGVAYTLRPVTARWNSRYQSQTYRDLANAIAIPAYLIHDAGLDASTELRGTRLDAGLLVANVFDVRDLAVAAEGGVASEGRGAYADFGGYPLPGRQWRLTLASRF